MESSTLRLDAVEVSRETLAVGTGFTTETLCFDEVLEATAGAVNARADPRDTNGGIRCAEASLLLTCHSHSRSAFAAGN